MRLTDLRNRLLRFLSGGSPAKTGADTLPESLPPPESSPQITPPATPEGRWSPARRAVADALWGEGFVLPGGQEDVLRWVKPLGMTAASSLLMLGAASGGAAAAVVGLFGSWVSGHEADPELAAAGAERIAHAGRPVSKHASVTAWDPQAPVFRRRAFNHALSLEALRGAPGRPVQVAELLLALAGALRPGGHLVMIEVVGDDRLDPDDPVVAAWARVENRLPRVPTQQGMTAALTELGFDVRVAEDITARHVHQVMTGWMAMLKTLSTTHPDHALAAATVAEAEVWLRRVRLMQAGQVRLMRFHALGKG